MDKRDALELWLVRHGQSTWNAEGRIQGQKDAPLSELGKRQARALQSRLANHTFDVVYSSDLARAFDTGSIAMPDVEILKDERLRELGFGNFEGKLRAELNETEKADFSMWRKDMEDNASKAVNVYGIESNEALLSRFDAFLADMPKVGKVIAFSHGGLIRSALHYLLGMKASFQKTYNVNNTSITRIELFQEDDFIRVTSVNDAAHLEML